MSNELLTKNVSIRICEHMNRDHKDSIIKYAKYYGGVAKPENVEMLEIKKDVMILRVDGKVLEIPFDHEIKTSSEAHKTLVAMIKKMPI